MLNLEDRNKALILIHEYQSNTNTSVSINIHHLLFSSVKNKQTNKYISCFSYNVGFLIKYGVFCQKKQPYCTTYIWLDTHTLMKACR